MRSANIIHSSGNDLLILINEVLDLRIEAGRMELRVEQVDLHQVAEGILGQFGPIAEERGLQFDVGVDEKCPQQVRTDPKRLSQILRNLISNAIKFTDKGGITVQIARPGPQEKLPHGLQRETTVSIAGIPGSASHPSSSNRSSKPFNSSITAPHDDSPAPAWDI